MSKHIVDILLNTGAYMVTRYLSPKLVVRATLICGKKKLPRAIDLRVNICAPNYREREFIRACKKAGEKFPLKKDQLRFPRP